MILDFIESFNTFAWLGSNLLVLYITMLLVVFVSTYSFLFDPRATTAGRFLFRFILSLIGIVALVFISIFINPSDDRAWYEYPGDVYWWRPTVRLIVYGYVAYTLTALEVLLFFRKFYPERLQTSINETTLVKVRNPKKNKGVNDDVRR